MESHDIIWLHQIWYQDVISADAGLLPEVHVELHEVSNDDAQAMANANSI